MYDKWKSCDVWFLKYEAWQTDFFVILDHFLPFCLPNNPKNQNFEKMKKTTGVLGYFLPFYLPNSPNNQNFEKMKKKNTWRYHHFTIVYHKSWSYCSWDMVHVRYNYFSFWATVLPFYPPNSPKNPNLKQNEKSTPRYHHFTQVYQKSWPYLLFTSVGTENLNSKILPLQKTSNVKKRSNSQ